MAVPKRHLSKARRDKGSFKLPHQACGNCGYYKGEEVIKKG